MTDYIDRMAVRNELYEADAITMQGVKIINQFPAADVVEVVRCKDCIYSRNDLDMSEKAAPWLLCKQLRDEAFPLMVTKTDYCCWAKRKEGEE